MKKITALTLAILFLSHNSFSQITKSNWLMGGSFSYSKSKSSGANTVNDIYREIDIMPSVGYFVLDKGVVGIRTRVLLTKIRYKEINGTEISLIQNHLSIGPFIRYYLLPTDKRVNFLAETGFSYNSIISTSAGTNNSLSKDLVYSISAGPVIFLNSIVGIEFNIGYYHSRATVIDAKDENFKFRIGLQIHLEKEK